MTDIDTAVPTDAATQLVSDNNFRKGFAVKDVTEASGDDVVGRLTWNDAEPDWRLAQWGSEHDISRAPPTHLDDGRVRFENASKAVTVGPRDTDRGELELRLDASEEWDAPRESRAVQWPHLLVEQAFRPPTAELGDDGVYPVTSLETLTYALSVKLNDVSMRMSEADYDPELHTAQFQTFLTVENRNPDSADTGDFLWFGLPLYDYRYPDGIETYASPDQIREGGKGTTKFIYSVASQELLEEPLEEGEWVDVHRNVLPHVEAGLQTAFDRGYLAGSELEDFVVTGMNMGFEVPGVFDVSMSVRDFSLTAVHPS